MDNNRFDNNNNNNNHNDNPYNEQEYTPVSPNEEYSKEIPEETPTNNPDIPASLRSGTIDSNAEQVHTNTTAYDIYNSYPKTDEIPVVDPAPTYSYTAGGNPNINKDNPELKSEVPLHGIHTTYVPRESEPPKTDKKIKRTVPLFVLIICIIAGMVSSLAAGSYGVYIGTQFVQEQNGGKTTNKTTNGNGAIDAAPSETVKIELPEGTVANAAAKAGDSVVEITTETVTTSFFYGQYVESGAGSGVIIDADDGYIITCAHVIDGASTVNVTLKNGEKYPATIIGSDNRTDIAIIQVDAEGLIAAEIGNSESLVVGQTSIAIGNPLGTLGGTVTSGIISALNREITIDGQSYSLLQTDASINPGNSGGGLFDIEGKLIGVVNAKSGGNGGGTTIEGLGFAIPINQALEIAESLVDNGYVSGRASMGIYVYEVNQNTSSSKLYQSQYRELLDYINGYGVYFLEYLKGQNGDFEFGDKIVAIDGISVSTMNDISSVLEELSAGDEIVITVSRLTSDMKRSRIIEFETTLVENVPETTTKDK